jgi:hypothetical protein
MQLVYKGDGKLRSLTLKISNIPDTYIMFEPLCVFFAKNLASFAVRKINRKGR